MIRFLGPLIIVAAILVGGYVVMNKKAQAPATNVESPAASLPKSGNTKIDDVISALEQEAQTEATVAGEADVSAETVQSDSDDLNNLDQSYDSQF